MYIYQIYPNAFNSDQFFVDLANNMSYYHDLGVDTLLLCPITKSPFIDSGYDVEDYYSLNPNFGTFKQFEQLIESANKLNIKIMLDMVFNHTSDQHQWFKQATAGDTQYQDYYIFRDGKQNLNKWISGRTHQNVWTEYDVDKYYMHIYTPKQPDLNWDNPKVRSEMRAVLKFWIDKGISGFRLDVINKIGKDWETEYEGLGESCLADSKFHDIEKTFDYISELTSGFNDITFIGQVSGASKHSLEKYANSGIDLTLNFNHVDFTKDGIYHQLEASNTIFINEINKLFSYENNLIFFESHDLPRSINNFLNPQYQLESAQIIAILLLFNNHTPIIYQGQELGLTNKKFDSITDFSDIRTIEYYNIRVERGENPQTVLEDMNNYSRDQARFQFEYVKNSSFHFYKWLLNLLKPYKQHPQQYKLTISNQIISLTYGKYDVTINLSADSINYCQDNILFTSSLNTQLQPYQFAIYEARC